MTIKELAQKNIATVTHPDLSGGRVTFYIADSKDGYIGPWAKIEDAATDSGVLEPPTVPSWTLPKDGWIEYKPAEADHAAK